MSMEETTALPEQQDSAKETKEFHANCKKLIAILNGGSLLKPHRGLPRADLQRAMEELVKEEKEAKVQEIKTAAKELVKRHLEFDRFEREKRKEFEKALQEKQKEFNKESKSLFSKIDDLANIERSYYETLQRASTSPDSEPQN